MEPTPKFISEKILELLPRDGSPVLNRAMRVTLQRTLERPVSQEVYFAALDRLSQAKRIGRVRGQGGQIFYLERDSKPGAVTSDDKAVQSEPAGVIPEAELMKPLRVYLEGSFRKGLDLPTNSFYIVRDTSTVGPRLGRWARPDFIVVTAMRFGLLPGAQVDVHSFELKNEIGATDLAVYEALAQTRFTHFGHVVWHLPETSPAAMRLPEIQKQCDEHGIGLIAMRVPKQPESYDILADPVRKQTLPREVDGFLASRLSDDDREKLRAFLKGGSE
jgi:hypothetical protein